MAPQAMLQEVRSTVVTKSEREKPTCGTGCMGLLWGSPFTLL